MCQLTGVTECCAAGLVAYFGGAHGRGLDEATETRQLDAIVASPNYAVFTAYLNQDQYDVKWLRDLLYSRGFRRVRTAPKRKFKYNADGMAETTINPANGFREYVYEGDPNRAIYVYVRVNFPLAKPEE